MFLIRKNHPILKFARSSLVDLPTPANLSLNWNYGSLLGITLGLQIITGIILATRYSADGDIAFNSIIFLVDTVNNGWILRLLHSTGASFFFILIYLHIGRGLYYGSYVYTEVWNLGVVLLFILVITAFLGYVLPWGQMSYWGATVITNFLTAIPYAGKAITEAVWGGYTVGNPTLTRFFVLHYIFPFVMLFVVILHLFYLHVSGSSNPVGVSSQTYKVTFHNYYVVKDLIGLIVFMFLFGIGTFNNGYDFIDAENFIPANSIVTPLHIQPEWYFLFTYAILRSIPNKLGGVLGIGIAFLVLFLFRLGTKFNVFRGFNYSPISRLAFWTLVGTFVTLTWLGRCPAQEPYVEVSLYITILYYIIFSFILFISFNNYWFLN